MLTEIGRPNIAHRIELFDNPTQTHCWENTNSKAHGADPDKCMFKDIFFDRISFWLFGHWILFFSKKK